jgi:flavin reductase (DIM6/NTAB) family NADH-FMN oxidoreductase RutF
MTDWITPDQLRAVMRQWATGVALVTVGNEKHAHGMTVNSLTSISLEPPLILVSMERSTRTHRMALEFGHFAVTILHSHQRELSEIFAGRTSDNDDRFKGIETRTTPSGIPIPADSLGVLDCRIDRTITAGTHSVFFARVEYAQVSGDEPPLLYFNRAYRKLAS